MRVGGVGAAAWGCEVVQRQGGSGCAETGLVRQLAV
eukprot:CAMPEP_0202386416 /NCGR_PEP_ID=MMETSP1127-20130417/66280_1 /ASSEMBLY_ACC=CAM_ASM_000462 /TAXON_ID=3047 /ORGANISM="Dunaliella tertiolecta, Strain CCMP1320" /LENGTH=35 /DNA_ID= /DNA_START= /DNA_END= /DNA_ORIENTATION=